MKQKIILTSHMIKQNQIVLYINIIINPDNIKVKRWHSYVKTTFLLIEVKFGMYSNSRIRKFCPHSLCPIAQMLIDSAMLAVF
jgi:hypothetical protein